MLAFQNLFCSVTGFPGIQVDNFIGYDFYHFYLILQGLYDMPIWAELKGFMDQALFFIACNSLSKYLYSFYADIVCILGIDQQANIRVMADI